MTRAIPVALALLLSLSLTAVPLAADTGTGIERTTDPAALQQTTAGSDSSLTRLENTTNRLVLEDVSRSEHIEPTVGIGSTLAGADSELQADQIQYATVDRGFDSATEAERKAMVTAAYEALKNQSDALESREEQAVKAHAANELSSEQLLQMLVRNYEEAAVLSHEFGELEDRSKRVSGYSLSVKDERGKLEMHRTEMRSRLAATGPEADDPPVVLVQTYRSGYAVSMIDGNYVREATRFDNRDTSRENQFEDLSDALDHTSELYPWAYEPTHSPSIEEHSSVKLYVGESNHKQGRLETYIDGGTGDIYRELQVLNENGLLVATTHTERNDNLSVSINETVADGPHEITVTNPSTDDPVVSTISVDGFEIGRTDSDGGTLWYVPPSKSYELTVEAEAGRLNTSVRKP